MPPELRSESKNRASGHPNAGLENSLASVSSSTTRQEDLRKEIDAAWKTIPRFLFRIWTEKSGGNARLNTTKAITPAAFLDSARPPKKFEEVPIYGLQTTAGLHVRNKPWAYTFYSSWSQSLGFILSWATSNSSPAALHHSSRHISILDTSLISKDNVILSFPTMRKHLGADLPEFSFSLEFLIYGVVEGPGYCAVPFDDWLQAGIQTFIPRSGLRGFGYPDPYSPGNVVTNPISKDKIEIAKHVANLYPADFQVAIALYLLSVGIDVRREKDKVLAALMEMAVPRHWKQDKKVTLAPNMELDGMPDAVGAADLLQHLALHGFPRVGIKAKSDSVAQANGRRRALEEYVGPQRTSARPTAAGIEQIVKAQGRAVEAEDIGRMCGEIVGL